MRTASKYYEEIRLYIENLKIIDCHDHTIEVGPEYPDAIHALMVGYFLSDLQSASSEAEVEFIMDHKLSLEERWPALEKVWKRTCYTGYAQVTRRVMKEMYGEQELTLDALNRIQGKLLNCKDEKFFDEMLEKAGIVARLEDILISDLARHIQSTKAVLDGSFKMPPRSKLIISLPDYHRIPSYEMISSMMSILDADVTTLDEYLMVCWEIFNGLKDFGAVAFKDQSAYRRNIEYSNPSRGDAEKVFNWIMADHRRSASYPDQLAPLDDFLFHEFMRMARDLALPVQIHTGHMAGIRNDVTKTNAAGLRSVLELHREVKFDLFHANWPYSGDILFLAKNYPNVAIDFCWANIIDPIYCQNMMKQIISSVPHGKIHGFGSDFGGQPERAFAHASIAKDNIAMALTDMVEIDYLGVEDAKTIANMWLFENPNEFFNLGL